MASSASPTPASTETSSRGLLARWLVGFVLSLMLIGASSRVFHDSMEPSVWDPSVQRLVPAAGMTHRHRREGWADTRIGKHGVCAIPDVTQVAEPKLAIWGDSNVEGYQVEDPEKMAQQFTSLWNGRNGQKVRGVAVSGMDVAEFYNLVAHYEGLLKNVQQHVILFAQFEDLVPNQDRRTESVFRHNPHYRLDYTPRRRAERFYHRLPWLIDAIRFTGFDFLLYLTKEMKGVSLRFGLGTASRPARPVEEIQPAPPLRHDWLDAWDWLIPTLRKQTKVPIAFIYCPLVPYLRKGRIHHQDRYRHHAAAFAKLCKKHGVKFVNLEAELKKLFQERGLFARGFPNSRPGEGHLNRHGHRAVAEAAVRVLSTR